MKKVLIALGVLFSITIASAQKVINDPNAESRTVGSFHGIHVSSAIDVLLTQGNEEGVAVSASEKEYTQHIKTNVENGILKIWYDEKGKWWPRNRKLKAYISVKNIDQIAASGASDIKIDGLLSVSEMDIHFSGASDLKGKLEVSGKLNIDLSGASDVSVTGSANDTYIDLSGASDVKAYDFVTATCNVKASGASDVHITVNKELSANISGASSISYKGTGTIRDIKTSGASNISHKS